MESADVDRVVREIGLALSATHNTVATDVPETEPNETSWRVDNGPALAALDMLSAALRSTGTDPGCSCRRTSPSTPR